MYICETHHAHEIMYARSQTLLYKRLRCLHRPYFCSQTCNLVYEINQNLSSTSRNLNGFKIKKKGKHNKNERSTSRTHLSFFESKTPTLGFLKSRPHSGTPKLNIFKTEIAVAAGIHMVSFFRKFVVHQIKTFTCEN